MESAITNHLRMSTREYHKIGTIVRRILMCDFKKTKGSIVVAKYANIETKRQIPANRKKRSLDSAMLRINKNKEH